MGISVYDPSSLRRRAVSSSLDEGGLFTLHSNSLKTKPSLIQALIDNRLARVRLPTRSMSFASPTTANSSNHLSSLGKIPFFSLSRLSTSPNTLAFSISSIKQSLRRRNNTSSSTLSRFTVVLSEKREELERKRLANSLENGESARLSSKAGLRKRLQRSRWL